MKFNKITIAFLAIITIAACKKESFDDYSAGYDIPFPVPTITKITPETAEIGTEITIEGTNLGKTNRVIMGKNLRQAEIVSKSETAVKVKVPRTVDAGPVMLETAFKKFTTSTQTFKPIYPKSVITGWPSQIERSQPFKIKGENLDLITTVYIQGQKVNVAGAGALTQLSVPTQGLTLPDAVVVKLEGLGDIDNGTSPSIPVVDYNPNAGYDPVAPKVIWDFEDGVSPFEAVDISSTNGINAIAIPKGRGANYLSIHVDDVPDQWNTLIGKMKSGEVDLTGFHDPHLTFLVNTNGKQGYAQLVVSQGGVRGGGHFTGATSSNSNDNYTFATNGWEWRSIKLTEFPFENWFGDGALNFSKDGKLDFFSFEFKQGNGADPFEISLDQVMITDGPLKPVAVAFDFENGAFDFQTNTGATTGINAGAVAPISGNNYLTVQKDAVASWDWTGAVQKDGPFNLGDIKNPFLNVWVNTGTKRGYFQVEMSQSATKWGIGQTSPDYLFSTNGAWQLVSLNLSKVGIDKWGGDGTEFDIKGALEYIKIGFSTGNTAMEDFEINIDDVILSDGPMY
jgi:hypothetical protein